MEANIERAAILLLGMGEAQAAEVMKYMQQSEVEKIVGAMAKLGDVDQNKVNDAVQNFLGDSGSRTGMGVNNNEYIRNTLISALGKEKAESIIDKTLVSSDGGFEVLKWQTPTTIYDMIHHEHPQLIAVTMTMLGDDKAAAVMKMFPDELRLNVVNRIATIKSLSPIALSTINEVLEKLTANLTNFKEYPIGGAKKVADIVNYLDSDSEDAILESLSALDEDLTERVQELMFPFERIGNIEGRGFQVLLREVPTETLTLALKACDDKLKELIYDNMSSRAAEMIKDDLEAMGPTALVKVLEAQKEVVAVAQTLIEEGKVAISGGNSEAMV